MSCKFPTKGNCHLHGCLKVRIGATKCEDAVVDDEAPPSEYVEIEKGIIKKQQEEYIPDEYDIKYEHEQERKSLIDCCKNGDKPFIVTIGNKAYFNTF